MASSEGSQSSRSFRRQLTRQKSQTLHAHPSSSHTGEVRSVSSGCWEAARRWVQCCLPTRGLVRLESGRALRNQQLQNLWSSESQTVELQISLLSGQSWHLRVGVHALGSELRACVAAKQGVAEAEVALVLGARMIEDDEQFLRNHAEDILEGGEQRPMCVNVIRVRRRWALSGSVDGTMKLWDLDAATCVETLRGHADYVRCMSVDWESKRSLSGSDDKTLKLWDLERILCVETLHGHSGFVSCLAVDWPHQRALSGSSDQTIRIWDLGSASCIASMQGHQDLVLCVVLDWHALRALTGSCDHTLKLWELQGSSHILGCAKTLSGHEAWVRCLAADTGLRQALSGSEDGALKLWDLELGKCKKTLPNYAGCAVTCLAVNWCSCRALCGFDDGLLKLLDFDGTVCLRTWQGHEDVVCCVAADWASNRALSGSNDGVMILWDLDSSISHLKLPAHDDPLVCVALEGNHEHA